MKIFASLLTTRWLLIIITTIIILSAVGTLSLLPVTTIHYVLIFFSTIALPTILFIALILLIILSFIRIINNHRDTLVAKKFTEENIQNQNALTQSIQQTKTWLDTLMRSNNLDGNRIEKIIDEKKQKFLNIPNITFHYANSSQIKDFYNDYFKEPTIESLMSEVTGEASGEIKGSLPKVIEAGIGSKDISKWVSTIKVPDATLTGMFLRYQRETLKKGQVILGIEEVDIELTELQGLEELVQKLQERFGLTIDVTLLERKRTELKEKAAERTLINLEQVTGWVLVEGKFKIERAGNFYKCTCIHPVNTYLSSQMEPVTISVLISLDSLEEHIKGNYMQSVGRTIPLKIYGQVWQPIDRQNNVWDLQLTPLAIY